MKLYHGTNTDFGEILLSRCRPNKDFGRGFYLTLWHGTCHQSLEENMKLSKNQYQFIVNSDVEALVAFLHNEQGLSILDAFDRVYSSRTYEKLSTPATGLYLQSPEYIYDYLLEELATT